jgi:uncharacterized protein YjbI with pentapeptide repeats
MKTFRNENRQELDQLTTIPPMSLFHTMDLRGYVFTDLNLDGCTFHQCNLTDVQFIRCSLVGCNFEESEMTNGRIIDCDTRRLHHHGVKNFALGADGWQTFRVTNREAGEWRVADPRGKEYGFDELEDCNLYPNGR